MRNYDRDIVECAKRLVAKLTGGTYYTCDGEFSPKVKKEIERMKAHCEKSKQCLQNTTQ